MNYEQKYNRLVKRYQERQVRWIYTCLVLVFAGIYLSHLFTRTLFPIYIEQRVVVSDTKEVIIEIPMEDKTLVYREYGLPTKANGSFKSYMDYETITAPSSRQFALKRLAVTDENGFRRINGKYVVAMGTYYADRVGKEFKISLSTGQQIWVIIGDIKQDIHTDPKHQYIPRNGNIVEFIVDEDKLNADTLYHGDISYSGIKGSIVKIEEVTYASIANTN